MLPKIDKEHSTIKTEVNISPATAKTPEEDVPVVVTNSNQENQHQKQVKPVYTNDIALVIKRVHQMNSGERVETLNKIWKPDSKFTFPESSVHGDSCKLSWLKKYEWLAYSPSLDALFCIRCILSGDTSKDCLTGTGLTFWRSATSKLKKHDQKSHENFEALFRAVLYPSKSIDVMANKIIASQVKKNRMLIKPIISCIIFLGKNNIALRGKRDDSQYYLSGKAESHCGNFQNVLDLVLKYAPEELKTLVTKAPRNATYRSKTIQNQIIDVLGSMILSKIVADIKQRSLFSVLADEATDVSNKSQMSLVLRYMNAANEIKEKFVGFLQCINGTTGEALAEMIINQVEDLGLEFSNVRGQGYDGAGAMAGKERGVAARITRRYPLAPYVHCFSHKLNLCIMKVTKIESVRDMFEHSRCISEFFGASPKRTRFYESVLQKSTIEEPMKKKLINICRTRWVQRIDGLTQLVQSYVPIYDAVKEIAESKTTDKEAWENSSWDTNTRVSAIGFQSKMKNFSFLLTVIVVKEIFSYVSAITTGLQASAISIVQAYQEVSNVIETINAVKQNIEQYHKKWFTKAIELGRKIGIEPKAPRVTQRMVHRSNAPAEDEESYFRRNLTVPCLDEVLAELRERFNNETLSVINGFYCIPSIMAKTPNWKEYLLSFAKKYRDDMPSFETIDAEIDLWENLWLTGRSEKRSLPNGIEDTLMQMPIAMYPNTFKILHLLAVLPVTTCSCERSISTLRTVKTYLRNSMTQDRFNGLVLLHVHDDIDIDIEEVIDLLAMKYPKRLKMLDMLNDD